MKSVTFYQCEVCGAISADKYTTLCHEAAHYDLSLSEYEHWKTLKDNVRNKAYTVSVRKNAETDALLDKAIEELIEFEKEHDLRAEE